MNFFSRIYEGLQYMSAEQIASIVIGLIVAAAFTAIIVPVVNDLTRKHA